MFSHNARCCEKQNIQVLYSSEQKEEKATLDLIQLCYLSMYKTIGKRRKRQIDSYR